jgi:hypothetical protein
VIDITMETRGLDHIEALMTALRGAGYALERVM